MSASVDSGTWQTPAARWSSFAALYRDHYEFVWRCAARMGVGEGELEDVVQETFVIAMRRLDEFDVDAPGKASSWLFAILRNVIRNHARGERRRQARLAGYGQRPIDLEQRAQAGQAGRILGRRLLVEFLDGLDDKRRAVFVLAELEGLTGREIADALDINVNTAHARLRAARQAFTEHFGEVDRLDLDRVGALEVPEAAARRSWAVLVGLGPGQGLVATGGTALGSLGLAKLAAGFAAIALVGVGGFAVHAQVRDSTELVEREPATVANEATAPPAPAVVGAALVPDEPEPTIVVTASPDPRPPAIQRPSLERRVDSTEALQRLAVVRQALLDDDAAKGLDLLRSTSWPPELAEYSTALEIGASCRLDRADSARRIAERWQSEHPDRPLKFTACWIAE
jgi:RNA polymerase sigma factor (sigma-70 family)